MRGNELSESNYYKGLPNWLKLRVRSFNLRDEIWWKKFDCFHVWRVNVCVSTHGKIPEIWKHVWKNTIITAIITRKIFEWTLLFLSSKSCLIVEFSLEFPSYFRSFSHSTSAHQKTLTKYIFNRISCFEYWSEYKRNEYSLHKI